MSATNASLWHSDINAVAIPDQRQQWLSGAGRLVQAFKAIVGDVAMEKVQEIHARPFIDEQSVLNLADKEAHIRQVIIATQSGQRLCYARVVIPKETYEAYAQLFLGLGNQFIGDSLLYNNKEVVRGPFEFACFGEDSLYADAFYALVSDKAVEKRLWAGRRSIFLWRDYPLLITEFLLPYLAAIPYTCDLTIQGENHEL